MKLMTFNIQWGGIDERGSRIEHIQEVIREASPDFLAVQEANNFDDDDNRRLKELSQSSGLGHYALSPSSLWRDGKRYHLASLSRYPFKKIHKFSGLAFEQSAIMTLIDTPLGEVAICNLHLHSTSEDDRLKELDVTLNHVSEHEHRVLLGDFNSLSSDENYDVASLELEARFDLTDVLRQDYVDIASRLGLDDRSTSPTPMNINPKISMPIRIDYIYVTRSLAASFTNATVIKTQISDQASDHYPFVAVTS